MGKEIERKFLVKNLDWKPGAAGLPYRQGYLSTVKERTVRVRTVGVKGFLTIKGIGNASGASRYEWEKEIPLAETEELLKICEPGVIDKTRHLVNAGAHTFEVDEFYGENNGLIVAEVELASETDTFEKPAWLGEEVTGDTRYYNSMLMKHPFTRW